MNLSPLMENTSPSVSQSEVSVCCLASDDGATSVGQERLSSVGRARATDPSTSHAAAANAALFAGKHCDRILAALSELGTGTAHELAEACGLSVVQIDRRLPELQREGKARVLTMNGKPLTRDGFRVWAGMAA